MNAPSKFNPNQNRVSQWPFTHQFLVGYPRSNLEEKIVKFVKICDLSDKKSENSQDEWNKRFNYDGHHFRGRHNVSSAINWNFNFLMSENVGESTEGSNKSRWKAILAVLVVEIQLITSQTKFLFIPWEHLDSTLTLMLHKIQCISLRVYLEIFLNRSDSHCFVSLSACLVSGSFEWWAQQDVKTKVREPEWSPVSC